MATLQLRLAIEDADRIAGALADAQLAADPGQDVSDLLRIEARLRYLTARARQRAAANPAA